MRSAVGEEVNTRTGDGVKISSESYDYDSRAQSHFLSCKVIMTWWVVYTKTLEECKKSEKKKSHLTKSGSNWQVSLLLSFMFIHATRQVRIRKISPFSLSPFLESEQIL